MATIETLTNQLTQMSGALNQLIDRNNALEHEVSNLRNNSHRNDPVEKYKIPDPIKSLQTYTGEKNHLHQWLRSAESTLDLFRGVPEDRYRVYFQAILNKIEGKAKSIICLAGDVQTFDEVKTILTSALGDRQELSYYKSQLWRSKMNEDTTIQKYYSDTKATIQRIKALAKQTTLYNEHWEAINKFIDEDALAAFISGLKKPYFGYAQASKPKDVEDAYAFLCKFTFHEKTANRVPSKSSPAKPWEKKNSFPQQAKSAKEEPMDVDPSMRSRLTFNKKLVNNNEAEYTEDLSADESESDNEASDEDEPEEQAVVHTKFSDSYEHKTLGINNYLPYVEVRLQPINKVIKLLIDTGSNVNLIDPGILKKTGPTVTPIKLHGVKGTNIIKSKGHLRIFNSPTKLPFLEFKFSKQFQGMLGCPALAGLNAQIDYEKGTITANGITVEFKKYYPPSIHRHTMTLETATNGEWLVPDFQKLNDSVYIEPGIYKAENNKTTINVACQNCKSHDKLPTLELIVNNFEALDPITIKKGEKISKEDIGKLLRTQHLSPMEKENLLDVIHQHKNVLLTQGEKLSASSAIKHKIVTTDEKPVFTKTYRCPHQFKPHIEEQIKEMLDNGIIRHSQSPYSAPIWVVPKKADASGKKKVRIVIDYRKLNEKTIDDKYPIPLMEEVLDLALKSQYFTTLDLKSGFHQISMDEKSVEKTAFSTDKGHFEFTRMPFGLKNAPATFQRAMNYVLTGLIGNICYVYLDDILILGTSLKAHLKNLSTVLKRLEDFNLKIQLDKCEFLKRETEFLGHIITPEGVKPNPDKIRKILDWPLPKSEKEIKQFLGLSGYYRRFIKDYSKLTKPITKYLKKDTKLDLKDEDYKKSFEDLKKILTSDQILAYPDYTKPFVLTTDASDFAIGAVLSQIQGNIERPIAFASRTLNAAESRYSTTEKEALAIVWATKKYESYLYGTSFTLITDHKPLVYLQNSRNNAKLLRWSEQLSKFNYVIKYKEGKTNKVADALSRRPEINVNSTGDDTVHSANTSDDHFVHFTERAINSYRNQLIFRTANFETTINETPFPGYNRITVVKRNFTQETIMNTLQEYHNGRQTAIKAPEDLIQTIQQAIRDDFLPNHFVFAPNMVEDVTNEERQNLLISTEHERAHRGIQEVENQLKRSYFFPRMTRMISSYINTCKICNMHKYERKPYNIKISSRPITDKPFDRVHMDIFAINKESFLSLIDSFSKHLQLIPIKTKNLTDVQAALTRYISTYESPRVIVTDHETTFTSGQLRDFLNNLGVAIEYASSSESNGQIERTHSTIIEIYNTNKTKFRDSNTITIIEAAVSLYNKSVHSTTKFTPNEIIFNSSGVRNRGEIEAITQRIHEKVKLNTQKTHDKQIALNENREDPPIIQDGQEVFLKPNIRTKTSPRANDAIAHQITPKTFKINNTNTKRNKNKIKRIKKP